MAFPHPKSRKDNHRKKNKPNNGAKFGISSNGLINMTEYRNAKDDVH